MALGPLTLNVTSGLIGKAFSATISGQSVGSTVEVLGGGPDAGTPGFSTVNGRVAHPGLPYAVNTLVLRETKGGEGFRDSRIDILADERDVGPSAFPAAWNEQAASAGVAFAPRVYDFGTGVLPDGVVLSRGGGAGYFDATGAYQIAAPDAPRLTYKYSGGAWVRAGLAVSPSRTNKVPYGSRPFTSWDTSGSATKAAGTALGVLSNPCRIASAGSTAARIRSPNANLFSLTAGTKYVITAVVDFDDGTANPSNLCRLSIEINGGTASYMIFNPDGTLNNNNAGAGAVAYGGATDLGNGLWRIWYYFTPTASSASYQVGIGPQHASAGYYVVAYTAGVYDLDPLPYLPDFRPDLPIISTSNAAATEAADVLSLTGLSAAKYRVRFTFDDGTTEIRSAATTAGSYVVPTDLSRTTISKIELLQFDQPAWVSYLNANTILHRQRYYLFAGPLSDNPNCLFASNREFLFRADIRDGVVDDNGKQRLEMSYRPGGFDRYQTQAWGVDTWSSHQFAIQADAVPATASTIIQQWHGPTEEAALNPPLAYRLERGTDPATFKLVVTTYFFDDYPAQSETRQNLVTIDPISKTGLGSTDEDGLIWHSLVSRIRFSRTANTAQLQVWLDGVEIYSNNALSMGYVGADASVTPAYPKFGNYRNPLTTERVVLWHSMLEVSPSSLVARVVNPLTRI